jgi:hypothetical protein
MKTDIENIIKNAFNQDPLIVGKHAASLLTKRDDFIDIKYYLREYIDKVCNGEIGICNGRRIKIDQKVARK